MLGAPELMWIALIFFLLFGAKKLPEFARSAGEAMKEFKKAAHELQNEAPPAEAGQRRMEAPASAAVDSTKSV